MSSQFERLENSMNLAIDAVYGALCGIASEMRAFEPELGDFDDRVRIANIRADALRECYVSGPPESQDHYLDAMLDDRMKLLENLVGLGRQIISQAPPELAAKTGLAELLGTAKY